uniref:Uncharacterized protein n=1 Tax=Plectus sambesii TaxID=2011161 RepID=A0A914X531_9BILA
MDSLQVVLFFVALVGGGDSYRGMEYDENLLGPEVAAYMANMSIAYAFQIDQFVACAVTTLSTYMKEMLLSGVMVVRVFPIMDIQKMFQRDMGMVCWRQSVYSIEPHMMYGLSIIWPVSCQPANARIFVEICYPVVKKSDMYSLFEVKHCEAFNADGTVFGYANIADHIAVPLHNESGRNVGSVENVDLARCEHKFGSVWTCRGLTSDHYKYCGLDSIVNCTWQLMPVKDHGFVYTRVIGDSPP